MSDDVKRWDMAGEYSSGMEERSDGDYVLASDYDALAKRCEMLLMANRDKVDWFNQAIARAEKAEKELERLRERTRMQWIDAKEHCPNPALKILALDRNQDVWGSYLHELDLPNLLYWMHLPPLPDELAKAVGDG